MDMRLEMEALSFYGTLGAIILLQISFYWLFRDDHYKRQITKDEIVQQKLSILLAASQSFLACRNDGDGDNGSDSDAGCMLLLWRRRLEQIGFIIYELRLDDKVKQLSFDRTDRVIRMPSIGKQQNHIDQAVCLIGRELRENDQKLHAFVSLPSHSHLVSSNRSSCTSTTEVNTGDSNQIRRTDQREEVKKEDKKKSKSMKLDRDTELIEKKQQQQERDKQQICGQCNNSSNNNKLINLIRDDHLKSYQLLSALSPILNQNSRIIQVQSQVFLLKEEEKEEEATIVGMVKQQSDCLHDDQQQLLLNLQLDIEALVNDYLRSEFARLNCGQLIEVVYRQTQTKPTFRTTTTTKYDYIPKNNNDDNCETNRMDKANRGNKSISEKCASTDKLFNELQKLLVLVNPKDRVHLI